ncbi:hypothetical protein BAE44_0005953 [Dichanthelium oligosanthes]|uniref:F-box associated beta-propeller type 3 domain-containing protein n=1 Tax=Dichanthelium oligosanthes TaxID=888268 RepID=A0A1E5W731_9POAL|nr:hypothetical protein BAE44_0005953 [Dichanthelium oligosanthes]
MFSQRASCSKKLYPSETILFDEAWAPSRWNVPVIEPDNFLCASCNGLVCLYSDKTTIKIANLATGEFLHLAKPDRRLKGDRYCFYNFGFRPVTKEYKVIHFPCERSTFPVGSVNVIQVYTLGDDKWRNITEVGGMVSFATAQEIFNTGREIVGKLEIWTLDNKVDQNWSQKYNIQFPSVAIEVPRHFFIHGDKIVIYDRDRNMYCQKSMGCSIEIEQSKMVKLLNYSPRLDSNMQSYIHVKSLGGLNAYRRAGIARMPKQREGLELKE